MKVAVLAGGTGGARLAAGFQRALPPGALSVITNTGDDVELWGLHVSPDTDAVLYRLAGIFNEHAGFGLLGESFAALDMLVRLGEPGWFQLGDRDLAVHVLRTSLLRGGMRPTEVTRELGRRLGVPSRVLPVSDERIRTWFLTESGRLGFQEYFVRERCRPRLLGVELEGLAEARPTFEALAAVSGADLVVVGPSNPLISIEPILALLRQGLDPERTVVVTPLVEGRALKGPTVEMLRSLGREPTPEGVARGYRNSARWFVLDNRDAGLEEPIAALGYRVIAADTVMAGLEGATRLAGEILAALKVEA